MQIQICDTCRRELATNSCSRLESVENSLVVWMNGSRPGISISAVGPTLCRQCLAKLVEKLLPTLREALKGWKKGDGGYRTMWKSELVDDK